MRGSGHMIEHDRWMTHPDDVDYLAPADRWCRVCGKPDREHVCSTCGRPADDPYRNAAAGEGCIDPLHDAFTDRRTGAVLESYPIYRSSRGGQDVFCGDVGAVGPVEALEVWARQIGITDYSLDQARGRVYVCPAHSVLFFYTYAQASAMA